MLDAFADPGAGRRPAPLSRRRVLTGGGRGLLALALLGTTAAACGHSAPADPDPLEAQLAAARRDSELATAAAKAAPPPMVPALTVIAAERARHAGALIEELARAAGKPIPSTTQSSSESATSTAPAQPTPPPRVGDVAAALRESADSAAKLTPTLSGYRAGLMGSIAAACATSVAIGFVSLERHR